MNHDVVGILVPNGHPLQISIPIENEHKEKVNLPPVPLSLSDESDHTCGAAAAAARPIQIRADKMPDRLTDWPTRCVRQSDDATVKSPFIEDERSEGDIKLGRPPCRRACIRVRVCRAALLCMLYDVLYEITKGIGEKERC